MKINNQQLKGLPLCIYKDTIYTLQNEILYSFNIKSKEEQEIVQIPISSMVKIYLRIPIFRRLFRLEFHSELFGENKDSILIIFRRIVYHIDVKRKKIIRIMQYPLRGRKPLRSASIHKLKGYENGIYLGEYFENLNMKEVKIFRYNNIWEKVFEFHSKEINHIHALVVDNFRNCIWILAGDFEHCASIWMAKNNFNNVQCIYRGKQIYRSCVAFALEGGLLYATDNPSGQNTLRLIKISQSKYENEVVCNLNGPCIYGVELKDYYVFSTSTEANYDIHLGILNLLKVRPAKGIIKNESHLIMVDKNLNANIISKSRKDILPYGLFQFGTFQFPNYIEASHNYLYYYSVANRMNDYQVMFMDLQKI